MCARNELVTSIAATIGDYRFGEITAPDAAHVERWVGQFPADAQLPILAELDHVLKHTYLNRHQVTGFLSGLITNDRLTGPDPCAFWRGVKFLDIQGGGNSQREMLTLFDPFLQEHCGFDVVSCGANATTFVYIDDAVFTGNRLLKDLTGWINRTAPTKAKVHIVTIAFHRGGRHYAETRIANAAAAAKKNVALEWWRCVELEDRKTHVNTSDVLRPRNLGHDALVAAYAASLRFQPSLRTQDGVGQHRFFSSEQGRGVLEQNMLKAGARIRNMCPQLNKYQRPLGNMVLETLGFGSTIVTFRNCPNNTPLAFWAGNPWYPLFARKTN